jgi:hypothetical protein
MHAEQAPFCPPARRTSTAEADGTPENFSSLSGHAEHQN